MKCLFCDIIQGNEPGYIIYEDEYVCCFLDKYPIQKGHILIVPKQHAEEIYDVDSKSMQAVILTAQKLAKVLETIYQPDGITLIQNNGKMKDVDHFHLHIFPRWTNDGFYWAEPDYTPTEEEFLTIQNSLLKTIAEY